MPAAFAFRTRLASCVAALVLVAACAEPGPPVLPGRVNAPPPPLAESGDGLITGTAWAWQGTQAKDGARIVPDGPERYTLEFLPGGQVNVRADCNRGTASYALNGAQLSFGPVALTKMMCPPGSRDADFLRGLAAAATHELAGSSLVLSLRDAAGVMRFSTPRQ